MKNIAFGVALAAAIFTTPALSQKGFDPTPYAKNSTLVKSFPGPKGWTGHIIQVGKLKTSKTILWQAPSGIVTFGKVFDKNGRNLTLEATEHHDLDSIAVVINSPLGGKASADSVAKGGNFNADVYKHLVELDGTSYTGDADSEALYVFYDFFCSYCADTHKTLKKRTGKKVKWLPVSILNENSLFYGAGVLDGDVSIESINHVDSIPYPKPSDGSVARVIHNTALLEALGRNEVVTPSILYKTKSGEVKLIVGDPEDEEIQEILASS